MKRFLLIFLILILCVSMIPMGVFADYDLPQYIRIGLLYGTGAAKTITLESEHGFQLGSYQEREFLHADTTAEKTVVVKVEGEQVAVYNNSGALLYANVGSAGIRPNAWGMNQKLNINGVSYRGGVHCIKDGGAMTVVNVVFMDHYLYGVISREMSPSWHKEALKAQAVCARNYAAQSLNKHKSQGFDLCAAVHCQAYSGTKAETDQSYAPVDETTRQVLTYDNKLAQLFYSSSMGARTEDVKNVWGSSYPYLVSVDNSYEDTENIPNGLWEGYLSCEEATTIMRNKGYDVGDVTDIKVLEYSENRRVLKMEVVGTNGSKVFERESCRTLFNTITKSQEFTVSGDGGDGKAATVMLTDGSSVVSSNIGRLIVLSASGRSEVNGLLNVSDGRTQTVFSNSTTGGKNKGFRFSGIGWGHGVGMSQYGAKGMAEAGFGYQDILLHYFVGTNLENAY